MTKNGTFSHRFLKRKMSPKPSPRTNLIFYVMSHDIVIMWISLRATAVDIFSIPKTTEKSVICSVLKTIYRKRPCLWRHNYTCESLIRFLFIDLHCSRLQNSNVNNSFCNVTVLELYLRRGIIDVYCLAYKHMCSCFVLSDDHCRYLYTNSVFMFHCLTTNT